jgi:trigger factor
MTETKETPETKEEDTLPPAVVKIEDAGAARKKITLEIPQERIAAKLTESFGEFQKDAVLPGFRRGRAPKRLIEKRFGSELKNTTKQQVVAEAYEKAVKDNKLEAIGDPEVDLSKVELPETGPLTVTVEVEVTPEFALPSLEKIAVKKPKLEANDERLNLAINNLQKHFGHWHNSTEPAKENDAVTCDVKVTLEDGTVIADQPSVQFLVKEGNIAGIHFADLGTKLTGSKPDTTVTLEGNLPDTHPEAAQRGKKAIVALAIKQISHQHLPEVTDEFATMLGFDNLDGLKADLHERLVVQLEQETKNAMGQQIYRHLLSNTQLEIPAKLNQRQMGNVLRRRATELMNKGVPESEIVQHIDELRVSSMQQAAVDLKLFFILSKLAEQFKVEVSEDEVNGRIFAIAQQYGRRPENLRRTMQQNGQIEQLYLQIRDGKVVDKILETAEVSEVDEKTLAEEFKNLPPLSGQGPVVTGVSHSKK